jgi:hypothetical protein
LGIEHLRNLYANAGMRITPERKTSERQQLIKTLRTLLQSSNIDPDRVIMWEALGEPHRVLASPEDIEDKQVRTLANAFKEAVKRELLEELSIESQTTPNMEWGPRFEAI